MIVFTETKEGEEESFYVGTGTAKPTKFGSIKDLVNYYAFVIFSRFFSAATKSIPNKNLACLSEKQHYPLRM